MPGVLLGEGPDQAEAAAEHHVAVGDGVGLEARQDVGVGGSIWEVVDEYTDLTRYGQGATIPSRYLC